MIGKDEGNAKPPQGPTGEGSGEKSTSSGLGATRSPNLVALTIDADARQIVDSTGGRRDLSDEEAASLTKIPTLEALIEQAFEAGIVCVLDDEAAQDEAQESDDDAALSRLLLMPLMERTPALGLQQPEVMRHCRSGQEQWLRPGIC
jgi:hypothetical protein